MIKTSNEFLEAIDKGQANYQLSAVITLKNGEKITITDADVWENGLKIEDATSSDTVFTIGSFVNTKLTLILNNINEQFTHYDFDNAVIKPLKIGLKLSKGIEWLNLGIFNVMKPTYNGSLITLSCQDNGVKLSKDWSSDIISFPTTLSSLAKAIAKACLGSESYLATPIFANSNYVIKKVPQFNNKITYGDMIACIAQIAGCFAKIDKEGRIRLDWYGSEITNSQLDGGTFSTTTAPYSDGDMADGGDFTYSDIDNYNGGTFKDMDTYHIIHNFKSFTINTDNFTISKVKVVEEFIESDDAKKGYAEYTTMPPEKADTYVVEVSGNPLIEQGEAANVAKMIGNQVIGITFRPMQCSIIADPLIEAGDLAYMVDRKNRIYLTFISSRSYELGNGTTLSCAGQTASEQALKSYTPVEKQIAKTDERVTDTNHNMELFKDETKTKFEVTDGAINAEVTRAKGAEDVLSNKITVTAEGLDAEIKRASREEGVLSTNINVVAGDLTSEIRKTGTDSLGSGETLYSRIQQKPDSISLSVTNDSTNKSSYITLSVTDGNGNTDTQTSGNITLGGDVVFESDLSGGTTTVSGDCIRTGTIDANEVRVINLNADSITSGSISTDSLTVAGQNISVTNKLSSMDTEIDNKIGEGDVVTGANGAVTFKGNSLVISASNFSLDADGNCSMTGKINATGGSIAGFSITPGLLNGSGSSIVAKNVFFYDENGSENNCTHLSSLLDDLIRRVDALESKVNALESKNLSFQFLFDDLTRRVKALESKK